MNPIDRIIHKATAVGSSLVFPEGEDLRVINAAAAIIESKIARVTLLGDVGKIQITASENNLDLNRISLIDASASEYENEFSEIVKSKLSDKDSSAESISEIVENPVNFGALMVSTGKVDGCIAGAVNRSGDVIRAALKFIGLDEKSRLLSGSFLMLSPDGNKAYTFADCGVIPDPSAAVLAKIAIASARNHNSLTGEEPRIAFLSFSTKGSANHKRVEKMREALQAAQKECPEYLMDGELQFDAAFDAKIGGEKAPESDVAGRANVFIFPDLDSGNIAYKIAQRMGGYEALGPILQGLKFPMNDLSRGCSSEDIVKVAAITAVQTENVNRKENNIYAHV